MTQKLNHQSAVNETEFEEHFRSVVEKRSKIVKRQKAVGSEIREKVEFSHGKRQERKEQQVQKLKELQQKRQERGRAMTQKLTSDEKAKHLSRMREEEDAVRHETNEERLAVHQMNLERRKRLQSEYKAGLVADLLEKQSRVASIGKQRQA